MTRREAAWLVARATATAAGSAFCSSWMRAAEHEHSPNAPPEPDRWIDYKPKFFSPEDFQSVTTFASILIPSDDTPGATEAHIAPFIDFVLFSAAEYAPETQAHWRDAISFLRVRRFGGQTPEKQLAVVEQMSQPSSDGFASFQLMKDLIVYAFYTSRAGLIDNLEYKGLAYLTEFPGCTHPEHLRA